MVALIFGLLCAGIFLALVAVRRVYFCVPAKELKRLARSGDQAGARLYQAVAFDGSLTLVLWALIGGFATASFVLLNAALPGWAAVLAIAALVWLGFAWLLNAAPRSAVVQLAVWLAPPLAKLLGRLQPLLEPVNRFINQHHRVFDHTGLYEKQDLLELLDKQQNQADSRVQPAEVAQLQRALSFGDRTANEIVLPKEQVRVVSPHETIGPKLLDELHKTGQQQFPVCETEADGQRVVGVVRLDDLVRAKQGGSVQSVTDQAVAFVRDDFVLPQVLQAFRQTGQRLLIVINNFEEFVGVVTLDKLFEALTGESQPADLAFDDRTAVASYQPAILQPQEVPDVPEPVEMPQPTETPATEQ